MIWNMYINELKRFFRNPFQMVFMLLGPVALIMVMGYAMSNIVGSTTDIKGEEKVKALYAVENEAIDEEVADFEIFKAFAEKSLNIAWEEVVYFEESKEMVDTGKAVALLRISKDGLYFYRSPYNEPTESKILRAAYNNIFGEVDKLDEMNVASYEIEEKVVDSYTYYTFAELGFIMLYISLIVGQNIFMEKDTKAFRRILISKANVSSMIVAKVLLGVTIGAMQIVESYLLSVFVLDVGWGSTPWVIMLTYLLLALFSSLGGAIMALFAKTRTAFSDKVLVLAILFGVLGGGLTPLTFLESIRVISYLCKLSPVYWIVNGAISVAGNHATMAHYVGILVCMAFIFGMVSFYVYKRKQELKKGVFIYE